MKMLKKQVSILALLVLGASGISAVGRLRGVSSSDELTVEGSTSSAAADAASPPSCQIFVEMLGRVYYLRDQLDRTTDSLSSVGYKPGEEWVMDQHIGNVTPATMPNVVCPLLANASVPSGPVSLLALHNEQPAGEAEVSPTGEPEAAPAPTEEPSLAERVGNMMPDWLTGGGAEPEPQSPAAEGADPAQPPAGEGAATEGDAAQQPQVAEGANNGSATEEIPANESSAADQAAEIPAVDVGCAKGSTQNAVMVKLKEGFDDIPKDAQSLDAIRSIYQELMLSIENGVLALYNYRGCPKVAKHEFKTRHVCEVHREEQARALQMLQGEVPKMSSRLFALQSRLREIDRGTSRECFFTVTTTREGRLPPAKLGWCLEMQAVTDALFDGRAAQKQWLKDMGNGLQQLGSMSMQLNKLITNPVLKKDKIPLNALKALTKSWKHLESPTQQLRVMGSVRAKQALNVDGLVLQLAGVLRNVSIEERCVAEGFRMRYGAQTCASLRLQLTADAEERQTDLQGLQDVASKMMQTASDGLIENKCTAPPMTQGCWLRLPTGCPNLPAWKSADKWTRDVFGEQSTGAGGNQVVCTVSRKIQIDSLCGVANTEMRFIPVSAKEQRPGL